MRGGHVDGHHLQGRAHRVALPAGRVDQARGLGGETGVEGSQLRLFQARLQGRRLSGRQAAAADGLGQPLAALDLPHLADGAEEGGAEALGQEAAGHGAADDVGDRRPVAGAAAAARIGVAPGLVVLHEIGVARPHVARGAEELGVVGGALGRGQDEGGDRLAGGAAALVPGGADLLAADAGGHLGAAEQSLVIVVVETGQEHDLVALAAGGAELVAARPPAVEQGLDPGARQGDAGGTPEDDGRDAGPVGLAGAGDGEMCSPEDLHLPAPGDGGGPAARGGAVPRI